LQTLDSLSSYLAAAYDRDISDNVRESLIFQQGRVVRPDFGEKYIKELPHKLRLQSLIILFKLAKHEGLTNETVVNILRSISQELFIHPIVFEKTKIKEFPSETDSGKFSIRQSEKALKDAAGLLGVSLNASDAEVKKAYRRMAKQYHPDVNKTTSGEMFIRVKQAYELLKQHRGFH
jgi:DnaJ-domain-containing protein 1